MSKINHNVYIMNERERKMLTGICFGRGGGASRMTSGACSRGGGGWIRTKSGGGAGACGGRTFNKNKNIRMYIEKDLFKYILL